MNDREFHDGSTLDTIAGLLKEFRNRIGLTQREVADRAGLSVGGVCDLEQRRVLHPRPNTSRRLADALELSPSERAELIHARQQSPIFAEDLRVCVLGPLSVMVGGECVDPKSVRQRKLLGLLALTPGVAVSRDTLIEQLWGAKSPFNAQDLLQTYVYRLRKRISGGSECASVLATRQGGYQLTLQGNQLDLLAFQRLVAEARRNRRNGHDASALACYERALGLWRGRPLADLPDLHLEPCVTELEVQRRTVIGEYVDTAFLLGRHAQVVGMLQREAAADEFDEVAHARLMVALVGAGRQNAALEVFRLVRARLAEDLGVAPGAELRELHAAILRGAANPPVQVVSAQQTAAPASYPEGRPSSSATPTNSPGSAPRCPRPPQRAAT